MVTLFLSSLPLYFSLATHVKYLWVETVIKAPRIVFLFTFPEGGREENRNSLISPAKTFALDALD